MQFRVHGLLVTAVLVGLSGCGGGAEGDPTNLVKATGQVVKGDTPVAGVNVSYQPDDGTKGTGGFGTTDAQGNFSLMHRSGKEGIEPGRYRVTLSKFVKPDGSPIPPGESAMDHNGKESMPAKLTNPETTNFRPEVKDGGEPFKIVIPGK